MARRRPRLDLTLPDLTKQVAEFCAEFPQYEYERILTLCRLVDRRLGELREEQRAMKRR